MKGKVESIPTNERTEPHDPHADEARYHAYNVARPPLPGPEANIAFWKSVALHPSVRESYLCSGLPGSSLGQLGAAGLWFPSGIAASLVFV